MRCRAESLTRVAALVLATACGARSGLHGKSEGAPDASLPDANPEDAGRDAPQDVVDEPPHDTGPRDAVPDTMPDTGVDSGLSCGDAPPIARLLDPVWRIPSAQRTGGHAFFEYHYDRVAVYGGGPVVNSRYYEQPVIAVELGVPSSRELKWDPADAPGWNFGAAARDPDAQRVFVVGGWVGGSTDSDRVVVLDTPDSETVRLETLPAYPHPTRAAAAGWDPIAKRLVVFGGFVNGRYQNEAFMMSPDAGLRSWQPIDDIGGDISNSTSYLVWTPEGLVLFTRKADVPALEELYLLLPGSTSWAPILLSEPLYPAPGPAVFDRASCTILWWGGRCDDSPRAIRIADGIAEVFPIETPPEVRTRVFDNIAIDPERDRVVVQGGYDCDIRTRFSDAVAYPIER